MKKKKKKNTGKRWKLFFFSLQIFRILYYLWALIECFTSSMSCVIHILSVRLQPVCLELICANKPRWMRLASPPNALINAAVWQTAFDVNICAFTFLWQGEVVRAGKQDAAAGGVTYTDGFRLHVYVFQLMPLNSFQLELKLEQMSLNLFLVLN